MAARVAFKKILGRTVRPASTTASRVAGEVLPDVPRAFFSKDRSKSVYEYGAHRSDAEARIAEVPVVMVDGPVALCDGGGGALGHPLDYVYLNNPDNSPVACQYCGIRYQMKTH